MSSADRAARARKKGDRRRRAPDGRLHVPNAHRWEVAARADRPYSVEVLAVALNIPPDDERLTSKLARRLRLNRRTVMRYRELGLTPGQADAWAARAGVHPGMVWPNWGSESPSDQEVPAPAWLAS